MSTPLYQVDAFTNVPFAGNPAAVVLLEAPTSAGWMARVAAEMNLSETAFVVPQTKNVFGLRWFTPTVEVDLCGHATLATAHVLHEAGHWDGDSAVHFETRSGRLSALRLADQIELDFPAARLTPIAPPTDLITARGAQKSSTRRPTAPIF